MAILVADSLWVREPNLLVPGKKPIGPMVLDRSANIVPDYLLIPGLPNQPSQRSFDLVKQKEGEKWDSLFSIASGRHGLAIKGAPEDQVPPGLLLPITASGTSHTFEFILDFTSLTNIAFGYLLDSQSGRYIIGFHNEHTEISIYSGGSWEDTGLLYGSSLLHIVVAANASVPQVTVFIRKDNGKIEKFSGTYVATGVGGTTRLFSRYAIQFLEPVIENALLYAFAFYDRALTDAEAASRLTDPYQFLVPA